MNIFNIYNKNINKNNNMKRNVPLPMFPPHDIIYKWNGKLEQLMISNPEFINIRNYLLKYSWSLECCKNVLSTISTVKMNHNNKDIILFITNSCCFHLNDYI